MKSTHQNNSPQAPGASNPPVKRSGLWRFLRFCLLGLITLITLFALYHVEENWRGKRAWKNYKAKLEAQGAVFEMEKLAPPPVPDDQNFAMSPLLKPLLDLHPPDTFDADGNRLMWKDPEGKARAEAILLTDRDLERSTGYGETEAEAQIPRRPNRSEWRLGERPPLADWQHYYAASTNFPSAPEPSSPAEAVLKALTRYDAELAELKQASQRPYSRFNISYEEANPIQILLSHLSVIRNVAKIVQLKAVAELEAGHIDAAFEDVQLLFALADSIEEEPLLISHLVRIALLKLTMQTVWDGMLDHRWTAPQLKQFQDRLASVNLVKELRRSIECERTFGSEMVELAARRPSTLMQIGGDFGGPAINLVPRGWWYLEGVNHSRVFDDFLLSVLPEDPRELDVQLIKSTYNDLESRLDEKNVVHAFLRHELLLRMLLPALGRATQHSVEAQTLADMATVAIALERYHLEHRTYPDDLGALAPKWMSAVPDDPVTHEPYHYERLGDGAFRLWSVGWDGVNDGGEVLYEVRSDERQYIRQQLDWVWPSTEGMRLKQKSIDR